MFGVSELFEIEKINNSLIYIIIKINKYLHLLAMALLSGSVPLSTHFTTFWEFVWVGTTFLLTTFTDFLTVDGADNTPPVGIVFLGAESTFVLFEA